MNALIERLAREAGFDVREGFIMPNDVDVAAEIERFAALVAQECWAIVDREVGTQDSMDAIRAAFPMPKG